MTGDMMSRGDWATSVVLADG
ncbi:MAG: hypothetical protein RLZZ362_748, partial [Actinomycetota bacterium]